MKVKPWKETTMSKFNKFEDFVANGSSFQKWPKIKRVHKVDMVITQKMNGTNGQILFEDNGDFMIGSRNQWLSMHQDNFGFYHWAHAHITELFDIFGPGRHYGEWCGPGIQNGEGLKERVFFSFNPFLEKPHTVEWMNVEPVPLLRHGRWGPNEMDIALAHLDIFGSAVSRRYYILGQNCLVEPEGIVVNIDGKRFKAYLSDYQNYYLKTEHSNE